MTAKQYFQAGQLSEAVRALNAEVRDNPADERRRTFLFELLCFSGEFDRAEKHLNVLAGTNQQAQMGAVLYHSALHAERLRLERFKQGDLPASRQQREFPGTVDGKSFQSISDVDPRIGQRLEVFAAGAYLWLPFEHIVSIEIQAPQRLRDLLWAPALVRTGPAFKDAELGEVLIPVLYPLSYTHSDEAVRLGRSTVWQEENGQEIPLGQKMFLVDGEETPLLEIRKIEFAQAETEAQQETASA
jgi:type VI secretion system protein ImpE